MYRLLIVTTNQATKDMLASMEGWEALGVKPPRVRETVEDAVECSFARCREEAAPQIAECIYRRIMSKIENE